MRKITNTSLHWQIDFIEKSLHYLAMPEYLIYSFSFEMKLRRFVPNNYDISRFMTLDLTNW